MFRPLFVSPATGSLHKAVVPENSSAYLVEEIQLSPEPEPVRNLQLAPTQVRRDPNRIWSFCGDDLGSLGQGASASDPLHLSPRVQCSQASQEASGEFPGPIAVSIRVVWNVSLPRTPTVPGTPSQKPAAFSLAPAPPCECWSWMVAEDSLPRLPLHGSCDYPPPPIKGHQHTHSQIPLLCIQFSQVAVCGAVCGAALVFFSLFFLAHLFPPSSPPLLPLPGLSRAECACLVFSGIPGSRTWNEATQNWPAPIVPWPGASGVRAPLNLVSVGLEGVPWHWGLWAGLALMPQWLPQHLPRLRAKSLPRQDGLEPGCG